MKKLISALLITILLCTCCSCSVQRAGISEYQYMYDGIVKAWNKQATPGFERESLLGFGEYLYNSQLLLFPRETPSTLAEYYFHWSPGIDVDGYAIYFTCALSEDRYAAFADGLRNFKLYSGEIETAPLYDDTHFELPTYILQWTDVEEKWEVLEYVMLDGENHTAVFVYTMSELERIERISAYRVTPSEMHFQDEDFSIYDRFASSTYDLSFLEYLM